MIIKIIFCIFLFVNLYKMGIKYFEEFLSYVSLIFLNLAGFKVNIESLKNVPSKSVIVMSHTSIYDFIFCSMIYHAFFKNRINIYIMMKEEFGIPAKDVCTQFFPYTHIIPINNEAQSSQNVVNIVVNELKDAHDYALCIAPEGTRRSVERIRSGFYYIAKDLKIPVVYCGIDFSKKLIQFETPRKMGNDVNEEKKWFIEMCRKYTPLYPEHCYYTNNYYTSLKCDEDNSTYVFHQNNPLFNQKIQKNQNNNDNNSEVSSLSGNSNIMNQLDKKIKKRNHTNHNSPISYFEMENPMLQNKNNNDSDSDSYMSQISTYE